MTKEFNLSEKMIMAEGSDANGSDFQEEIIYPEDIEILNALGREIYGNN